MRANLIVLFTLVSATLTATPAFEQKPEGPYFTKFFPIKAPLVSGLILKKGDRLAICGDSITEQRMYSRLMEDYLTMCVPQLKISVRQYGWSGEQVWGFLPRMTNDCLRFDPTVATTCYGMNDFHYRPYEDSIGQAYQENTLKMIKVFQEHHIRVVLGSPGCVSKVPPWAKSPRYTTQELNLSLCQLRNLDVNIARQEKVGFADVFWPMFKANYQGRQEYGTNYAIPGRLGVHPYWAGHLIMAYVFLHALGLNGDLGTFTVNLENGKMKVSRGHKLISEKNGEYVIRSTRYPFCACVPEGAAAAGYPVYGHDPLDSNNSIRSGMTLVPFNQQLNRLLLVAKNGKASRYQVTWGTESKTFSADQLSHGINLAADFAENPFSSNFAKVDAAVAAKEAYETKEMKDIFRQTGKPHPTIEEITAHTDQVIDEAEKEHAALAAAVTLAFVPVTHTIKITPEP